MKAVWTLTIRFLQKHWKQTLGSVAVLLLLSTAISSASMLTQCFRYTNHIRSYEQYGMFSGVTLFANEDELEKNGEALQKKGAGLIKTQARIETPDSTNPVYLGYMDEQALSLRCVRTREGRLPAAADEAAMERTAYYRLGLTVPVGGTVTLPVVENGAAVDRRFTLTGILEDYGDRWGYTCEQTISGIAEMKHDSPMLPTVLTGKAAAAPEAVHVLYPLEMLGQDPQIGELYVWNDDVVSSAKSYEQELNSQTANATLLLEVFFLLLALIGIQALSRVTLRSREQFSGLLDAVGVTKGQIRGMFLLHGFLLLLPAWLLSIPLCFGVAAAALRVMSSLTEVRMLWRVTWQPFAESGLLLLVVVLSLFLWQAFRLSGKRRQKQRKALGLRKRRDAESFSGVWTKLYRSSRFSKNLAVRVLSAGCAFLLCFGLFFARLEPTSNFLKATERPDADYSVAVSGAGSGLSMLFIPTPRGMGVSAQAVETLRKNPDLRVTSAYIDDLIMPAFVREGEKPCPYLQELLEQGAAMENQYGGLPSSPLLVTSGQKELADAKKSFGYPVDQPLLNTPRVNAVDEETARMLLRAAGCDENIDWAAFAEGKTVFAINTRGTAEQGNPEFGVLPSERGLMEGDEFILSIPVAAKGSKQNAAAPGSHAAEFPVAVVRSFSLDPSDVGGISVFFVGDPTVIISAEAVMKADPLLRFQRISAYNARPGDAASCARAAETMHRLQATGKNMYIKDRNEQIATWAKEQTRQEIPVFVMIFTFVGMALFSIALLNNIKLKANLHSYALLRAAGMEAERLQKRLARDCLRAAIWGVVIGLLPALGLCAWYSTVFFYLPTIPIFLTSVLPAMASGIALLLLLVWYSAKLSVRRLTRESISEELHMVDY